MDPILMKFQINYDLKYYEDALTELSKVKLIYQVGTRKVLRKMSASDRETHFIRIFI